MFLGTESKHFRRKINNHFVIIEGVEFLEEVYGLNYLLLMKDQHF